jgi:hypothetical protein
MRTEMAKNIQDANVTALKRPAAFHVRRPSISFRYRAFYYDP